MTTNDLISKEDAIEKDRDVALNPISINEEIFYKISNVEKLRPFFMSIVSDLDHWMFISSNGGLTAGRKNAQFALFPYSTDDKITESAETTGSKTIIKTNQEGRQIIWEPFSLRSEAVFTIKRNLYKSRFGNKIRFEEINQDLGLRFFYEWNSTAKFGFVRKSHLENISNNSIDLEIIDGIQDIMPSSVPSDLQNSSSNLVNAYKRAELHENSRLGIFALSAIIVDKAEPSEALKANTVWSCGLPQAQILLSSNQLNTFRNGENVFPEKDVKGERGAYFIWNTMSLSPNKGEEWMLIADVNKNHSKVADLIHQIENKNNIHLDIEKDIQVGTDNLVRLNATADSNQLTSDSLKDARHFSNVLFNNMRGGIFDCNYEIRKDDFLTYLFKANKNVFQAHESLLDTLDDHTDLKSVQSLLSHSDDVSFHRLATEYLPLKFSRRHGDPSRPWNRFSINMVDEKNGSIVLDYEGNWRDIFQNWEAMVHSFPGFIDGMIFRFLNASTFDGYNPYRITKDGFDWEVIEPDDPWSYIGYWGDHQIIYLLKFLEFIEAHQPGKLVEYFGKDIFAYAQVPYKIKSYDEIVKNPKDTIIFDEEEDQEVRQRQKELGADGALLKSQTGEIHSVNFIEKTLATLLAKMTNYIPEGGIWMNTQRPEWNDANNALVGNGISMVTLYYMRRFFSFFEQVLEKSIAPQFKISVELSTCFEEIFKILKDSLPDSQQFSDASRKKVTDALGTAASSYRNAIYNKSFTGNKKPISRKDLLEFISASLKHLDHTIAANRRSDNLYHAYNLLTIKEDGFSISYLQEMLEGQVGVLSAKVLNAKEVLAVLDGMKKSSLFRKDQYSYLLYPNNQLPGFLEKNRIPSNLIENSKLLKRLVEDENKNIIEKDVSGEHHFNSSFRNASDLQNALDLMKIGQYKSLVNEQEELILHNIYESVFNHKKFTGRSGTFYGYEGLGSIYWHMVSKLLLAVYECSKQAIKNEESPETVGRILEHFYEIYEGIGVHKSPSLYGAFPTDPYSHTPAYKGAQQPGMTGQVKEDILSRFGELGIRIANGQLSFDPCLLRASEFLNEDKIFKYYDVHGQEQLMEIRKGMLAFTYCQVLILFEISDQDRINVYNASGINTEKEGRTLSIEESTKIFNRSGEIVKVHVCITKSYLK